MISSVDLFRILRK